VKYPYTDDARRLIREKEEEMRGHKLHEYEYLPILMAIAFLCAIFLFPPLWGFYYFQKRWRER